MVIGFQVFKFTCNIPIYILKWQPEKYLKLPMQFWKPPSIKNRKKSSKTTITYLFAKETNSRWTLNFSKKCWIIMHEISTTFFADQGSLYHCFVCILSSCAGIQTRYHFLKKLKASPFQKSFKGKWEHLEKNTTLIEEFPLVVIIGLDDLCFQSSWLKQTTSISNCFIQDSLHSSKMRLDHLVSIMIIIDLKTQHYQKHLFGLHVECGPRNISYNF